MKYDCRTLTSIALALAGLVSAQPVVAEAPMTVADWEMPTLAPAAAQPDLVLAPDGTLLLSWIEKSEQDDHALRFSRFTISHADTLSAKPGWSPPRTIARGRDWFVNWADTPHLIALDDGTLWAHWLRRNGTAVYDYGIALVRSSDHGETWSAPIRVEPAGARNDYGFVSLWSHAPDQLGIAWLDSRQKPAPDEASGHDHDGHGSGSMMLRAAIFDAQGRRTIEWPLDASTCDCCPTAVAATSRGPVVVYRGRTGSEIRDTRLVRFENGSWTAPVDVHADGWKFAGCPVNGPAVVAQGNSVWAAWYTEADGQPSLRLAQSRNAGDSFDTPLHVAQGEGVLGRVALAIDGDTVWVAWLAERNGGANGQQIWLARIEAVSMREIDRVRVAEFGARGRASGLPRLQARDGVARLVWTDVVGGKSRLRGASVR